MSADFDLAEINVLYFDNTTKKLKNVAKEFEPAEDYFSEDKMNVLNSIYNKLDYTDFVINDDVNQPDDIFNDEYIMTKTLSVKLEYENKKNGFIRFKFRNKINLEISHLENLKILGKCISSKIMNNLLKKRVELSTTFYKSMKDIAKIIETQYDFQYIIPLIGEMIDKFALNHLIYIFIKNEDKYTLFWPKACWSEKVYQLIETLTPDDEFKISEDRKTGAFPLVSEGVVTGCVAAHSTIDKLTDDEIENIKELTKQSAITIEKANTYSEILQNATMDALTGLNNRRQFEVRLKEVYSIANRQNSPLCAIMLDIDFFKKFNDTYGHATGDAVLKTVANVIKQQLREYDIPSRYGGEEFCILLPHTNIDEAKVVAERLRTAVEGVGVNKNINSEDSLKTGNIPEKLTISIGLAQLDIKDMPEDLYMKADSALYRAKESGRNKVVVY